MKTVYYQSKYDGSGRWKITYWTKLDRSNQLTETFVTCDEEKLRNRLEHVLGIKHFDLVQVKSDGRKEAGR